MLSWPSVMQVCVGKQPDLGDSATGSASCLATQDLTLIHNDPEPASGNRGLIV